MPSQRQFNIGFTIIGIIAAGVIITIWEVIKFLITHIHLTPTWG